MTEIDVALVKLLIRTQFPQWAELPISPVENGGWDNRTFRLGDCMSVRLPSAPYYVAQVEKDGRRSSRLSGIVTTILARPRKPSRSSAMSLTIISEPPRGGDHLCVICSGRHPLRVCRRACKARRYVR
jgi:aminoglycoside phosphotransferase (APT) family kinase protein